jgi:leader peptidase (prepilin peptidase)/N-methyltransferase
MILLEYLQQNSTAFLLLVGLFSLMIGSFLNVVIHRLPLMMEHDWKQQCEELLANDTEEQPQVQEIAPYNLVVPRSACPHCGHKITAMENIPVVSYLFLGGKCSGCKKGISPRYPIVEISTALLSIVIAWHLGPGWQTASALLLTWGLICLTMIDYDHKLLPDNITLPLLWLGILVNINGTFVPLQDSVIGAIAGYMVLWSIFKVHNLLTGKEGMGYGDFKLLAMLGAWMGWQALPVIILMSSLVGAVVGILLILVRGRDRNIPIPFGPYLAAAGWITLLWGDLLSNAYLQWAGLAT